MPIIPKSSYYDNHYRQTAALIRARQPYLIKNLVTGAGLFAFAAGVYAFTFYAVKQDDFSDVQVPAAPAQTPHTPNVSTVRAADPSVREKL